MQKGLLLQATGNNVLNGIGHGVQLGLVNVIAADEQGDGSHGFRIHDGAEATLLTVHNQVRMGFRNDGDAAVVIDNLNQELLRLEH